MTFIPKDPNFIIKIDNAGTYTYYGYALPGTATSTAGWRIKRKDTASTVASFLYADGNDEVDNVWDNRSSLSYS